MDIMGKGLRNIQLSVGLFLCFKYIFSNRNRDLYSSN